jgi:hypothetical protein
MYTNDNYCYLKTVFVYNSVSLRPCCSKCLGWEHTVYVLYYIWESEKKLHAEHWDIFSNSNLKIRPFLGDALFVIQKRAACYLRTQSIYIIYIYHHLFEEDIESREKPSYTICPTRVHCCSGLYVVDFVPDLYSVQARAHRLLIIHSFLVIATPDGNRHSYASLSLSSLVVVVVV